MDEDGKVTFISIHWEDILFKYVLPELSLKDCFSFRVLSTTCKKLIDTYFGQLLKLNLSSCKNISNTSAFMVLSRNCRHLRQLCLSGWSWLKDDMVEPILINNVNIVHLNLNHCLNLSSVCLQPIIINCKSLKTLELRGCYWLTLQCLEAISYNQSELEVVNLANCLGLTNTTAIDLFVSQLLNLKYLALENILSVADSTMVAISKSCKQLEHLDVRGCRQITSHGVRKVGVHCGTLKTLLVLRCPLVTIASIAQLRSRMFIDMLQPDRFLQIHLEG